MKEIESEGQNNHSSLNNNYDSCISSSSGVFWKDKGSTSTLLNSLERLTKNSTSDTLFSKNEEKNMSAIIMYYDKDEGAVIVSDSRETKGLDYNDNKQKIYKNDKMIIGQIGLNYSYINDKKVEFGKLIVDALLEDKAINEAIMQKIDGIELLKLIPENKSINIFLAKKNGEVGVYDIKKDSYPYNNAKEDVDVFKNIAEPSSNFYNNYLHKLYIEDGFHFDLDDMENKLKSVMKIMLIAEKERENNQLGISKIGGKIQCAKIRFEK